MPGSCNNISLVNIFLNNQEFYFGEVTYSPGGRCGPRIQRDVQLVTVYSGEANVEVDGRSWRVGAREATILLSGHQELFLFSKKSRTHHSWCKAIAPAMSHEALETLARLPKTFPWTSKMEKLFRLAAETQGMMRRRRSQVTGHLGLALFYEIFYATGIFHESGKPLHPAVDKALQFLERNLNRKISSKLIATSAGVSYQHLARLFRNNLGSTPSRELWKMRAERGAELLRSTGLSVGEIAAHLGFQNPFHFSRCIKKRFSFSPVELREGSPLSA